MPRSNSTGVMTGTRFMKCIPIEAIRPTGRGGSRGSRSRTLEAECGPGRSRRGGEEILLRGLVLDDGLDDEVRGREPFEPGLPRDPGERGSFSSAERFPFEPAVEVCSQSCPGLFQNGSPGRQMTRTGGRGGVGDAVPIWPRRDTIVRGSIARLYGRALRINRRSGGQGHPNRGARIGTRTRSRRRRSTPRSTRSRPRPEEARCRRGPRNR